MVRGARQGVTLTGGWNLEAPLFLRLTVNAGSQLVPYRALKSLSFSKWPGFLILVALG